MMILIKKKNLKNGSLENSKELNEIKKKEKSISLFYFYFDHHRKTIFQKSKNRIDEEQREIERRRNMTNEEIIEEDKKNPNKTKSEKSKYNFLQKYYHKGAYYQVNFFFKSLN